MTNLERTERYLASAERTASQRHKARKLIARKRFCTVALILAKQSGIRLGRGNRSALTNGMMGK
jgi:hypothetical protein